MTRARILTGSKDCAPKRVDDTKKRQHSIEFAMAKIHETYNSKHKSGRNFEKKEYRKSNGDYWRRSWPASICLDTIPGYTVIQNFRPDGGRWAFRKFRQFCPDWLLAFLKISTKSVQIVTKQYQASPTIGWGPLSAQRPPQGHRSLALSAVRTCPKVCRMSDRPLTWLQAPGL